MSCILEVVLFDLPIGEFGDLEKESNSICVCIKVRLMSNPQANPREAPSTEPRPQPVCLLKFLLLVNNGSLEYIQFIAPHEDWSYTETNQVGVVVR